MLIEFAGPSCTGKSTLIRRVAEALAEQGVPFRLVSGRKIKTAQVLTALCDPRLLAWSVRNLPLIRRRSRRQMLTAIARSRRARRRGGVTLLDEGPVKLSRRPSMRAARGRRLLARSMPAPDLLVLVTCDPDVRLVRLRENKRRHAAARSDEELLADGTADKVVRGFAAARRLPLLVIDTSRPEDPLPRLFELLEPYLELALAA